MGGPDWESAARFLAEAAFDAAPEVIETHTARVHLAGARVWKLRRPVDYGWLDYATRARRREMAEREIALNAPAAPGLYLGLGGVATGPRLIGPDAPVPEAAEPLVVMRRFASEHLFDRMAERGRLDPALMQETGRAVAAMHRREAPEGAPDLAALAAQEADDLARLADPLGPAEAGALARALQDAAAALAGAAATRRVRRCHGDLHLGNIVLWQGLPAPFDCIEFNEDLARIDPLYDLAFLAMDLEHRDLAGLVAPLLSAWAEAMAAAPGADPHMAYGGFALWPLYRALRAAIRAKIAALAAGRDARRRAEAQDYLALARGTLAATPAPRLIAVGGRSASGKSTLALGLAQATGALVIRSDAVRKGRAGLALSERLPRESYTAEAAAEVYDAMAAHARAALAGGMGVILDAAHLGAGERAAAGTLARELGVDFRGFWLEADTATLAARAEARRGDVSDADASVVRAQAVTGAGATGWTVLDARESPEAVLDAARAAL